MVNSGENNGMVTVTVPTTGKAKPAVRFFGTFSAKVATTNQVTLPKAFKKAVEDGEEGHLVLLPNNSEAYWQLFTLSVFNQKLEDITNSPKAKDKNLAKEVARNLAKKAIPVETDSQGRFVLSREFTAKMGGESNEVVFESAHTHLRLWAQGDYERAQEKLREMEQLEEFKELTREVLDI